jgi:hypothetical protein
MIIVLNFNLKYTSFVPGGSIKLCMEISYNLELKSSIISLINKNSSVTLNPDELFINKTAKTFK